MNSNMFTEGHSGYVRHSHTLSSSDESRSSSDESRSSSDESRSSSDESLSSSDESAQLFSCKKCGSKHFFVDFPDHMPYFRTDNVNDLCYSCQFNKETVVDYDDVMWYSFCRKCKNAHYFAKKSHTNGIPPVDCLEQCHLCFWEHQPVYTMGKWVTAHGEKHGCSYCNIFHEKNQLEQFDRELHDTTLTLTLTCDDSNSYCDDFCGSPSDDHDSHDDFCGSSSDDDEWNFTMRRPKEFSFKCKMCASTHYDRQSPKYQPTFESQLCYQCQFNEWSTPGYDDTLWYSVCARKECGKVHFFASKSLGNDIPTSADGGLCHECRWQTTTQYSSQTRRWIPFHNQYGTCTFCDIYHEKNFHLFLAETRELIYELEQKWDLLSIKIQTAFLCGRADLRHKLLTEREHVEMCIAQHKKSLKNDSLRWNACLDETDEELEQLIRRHSTNFFIKRK